MLRKVVGVNVGVVRVGTPEFNPSRVKNCNKKNNVNMLFNEIFQISNIIDIYILLKYDLSSK